MCRHGLNVSVWLWAKINVSVEHGPDVSVWSLAKCKCVGMGVKLVCGRFCQMLLCWCGPTVSVLV